MKLVLEFVKTGNMIYISHLDLGRLFLRVLRMSGLRPEYSHGYNPHPKMSFALPLSLGIHSVCELLEVETECAGVMGCKDGDGEAEELLASGVAMMNERLPEGVRVKAWQEKPSWVPKPLASYVAAASYEFMCDGVADAPEKLAGFFARESVVTKKWDKKKEAKQDKDIRAEMLNYRIIKNMRGRMLAEATLSAAAGRTLNPVVFFGAFCEAAGLDGDVPAPVITRTAILGADGREILPRQ